MRECDKDTPYGPDKPRQQVRISRMPQHGTSRLLSKGEKLAALIKPDSLLSAPQLKQPAFGQVYRWLRFSAPPHNH
ncbi:hypothetical protein Aduo_005356 [Ancylostoma duodenale]